MCGVADLEIEFMILLLSPDPHTRGRSGHETRHCRRHGNKGLGSCVVTNSAYFLRSMGVG